MLSEDRMAANSEPQVTPGPSGAAPPSLSRGKRVLAWLKAHPIVCLMLLTPGIPEYLSTSSSIADLVINPAWFFLAIAINVGQYTAGALLIREAALRWGKGWATIFLLAGAYGITEEGLGDNTLFYPKGPTGVLGSYGHFLGVNWVWSVGVLTYHVIFSVGLPILLLGLALPETRGRTFLSRKGVAVCLGSLSLSTGLETTIVWGIYHFWMGNFVFLGALVAIALLVLAAYVAPPDLWRPRSQFPTISPSAIFSIGFLVFLVATVLEYGFASDPAISPLVPIAAVVVELGVFLEILRRGVGRERNEYLLVILAYGFLIYLSAFGLLVSLTALLPVSVPLIVLVVIFLERLRAKYSDAGPMPASGTSVGTTAP
jgi:hypothetical protein